MWLITIVIVRTLLYAWNILRRVPFHTSNSIFCILYGFVIYISAYIVEWRWTVNSNQSKLSQRPPENSSIDLDSYLKLCYNQGFFTISIQVDSGSQSVLNAKLNVKFKIFQILLSKSNTRNVRSMEIVTFWWVLLIILF